MTERNENFENIIIHRLYNKIDSLHPIVFSLLASIISLLYSGYSFGLKDHVLQIPFAKSYSDPTLYPGDPMIAQTGYVTLIWRFFSTISGVFPYWFIAILLYVLCIWIYFFYLYKIGYLISEKRIGGILTVLLLITPKPGIAYSIMTHDTWFSLRVAALPLITASIYYALKGSYSMTYILLGIAFNVHLLSTVHVCLLVFSYQLYSYLRLKHLNLFNDILKPVSMFILFALPNLIIILNQRLIQNDTNTFDFVANDEWLEIMRMRNAHVVFPFYFDFYAFYNVPIYLFVIFFTRKSMNQKYSKQFLIWFVTIFFFFIISIIFSHLIPIVIIIQFQFARILKYLPIIGSIYLANHISKFEMGQKISLNDLFMILISIIFIFTGFFIITIIIMGILYVVLYVKKVDMNAKTQKFTFPNIKSLKSKISCGIVIFLLVLPQFIGIYIQEGRYLGQIQLNFPSDDPWVDIQVWTNNNTPKSSMIISPPHIFGFRVNSERSILGEWKDGTLSFFNETYGNVWWSRMQDLGYDKDNYNDYDDEIYFNLNFTALAFKYDASYVVTPNHQFIQNNLMNGQLLYFNQLYSIYSINNS